MNIVVIMPTRGLILTEVQMALDRELAANKQIPIVIYSHDMPLPVSRNYLVETALKVPDVTHILMLDDDVILPEGGLKELIDLNTDVAVMDYPIKMQVNGKYIGTVVYDKKKSGLAWGGVGAVLVKKEVLEKMDKPYFAMTNYRVGRDKKGNIGFFAGQNDSMQASGGEDTYFFLQCRKYGVEIKVAKKIAVHAYVEQLVSPVSNHRYQTQHKIIKRDKIQGQLL